MPFNIIESILIVVVSVSLVGLLFPTVMRIVGEAMDSVEVGMIKSQFDSCSERILETARTGSTNKCFFNINRGDLTGMSDGISYKIVTTASICDKHFMTLIDEKRHIWQSCDVIGNERVFEMKWMFPQELEITGSQVQGSKMSGESPSGSITIGEDGEIDFRTLSVYVAFEYTPGESGNVVEMGRLAVTDEDVTLRIRLY